MSGISKRFMRIAAAVRRAGEAHFPSKADTLRDTCTLMSCALICVARSRGFAVVFCGGEFTHKAIHVGRPEFGNAAHIAEARRSDKPVPHAWTKYGRNYVDLTLTQFDPTADGVAVLPLDDPRFKGKQKPFEFAVACLPLCGHRLEELDLITARAYDILKTGVTHTFH